MGDCMNKTMEIILLAGCNFSCDYCISGSNKNKKWKNQYKKVVKWPSSVLTNERGFPIVVDVDENTTEEEYESYYKDGKLTLGQAIDGEKLIKYASEKFIGWDLIVSGGEPLLYPNIDVILNHFTMHSDVILLTNASLIQKFPNLMENPKIFFRIGFHPDYRDLSEFYENVLFLANRTDNYIINYVHHPKHRESGKDIEYIDMLKEWGFRYEITAFKGKWKGVQYEFKADTIFDKEFISEAYTELVPNQEKLLPGISFGTMYGTGKVYSCHRTEIEMGSVSGDDLVLSKPKRGYSCLAHDVCGCDSMRAYRNIEKIKNSKDF